MLAVSLWRRRVGACPDSNRSPAWLAAGDSGGGAQIDATNSFDEADNSQLPKSSTGIQSAEVLVAAPRRKQWVLHGVSVGSGD
jgi:hypothetical protein